MRLNPKQIWGAGPKYAHKICLEGDGPNEPGAKRMRQGKPKIHQDLVQSVNIQTQETQTEDIKNHPPKSQNEGCGQNSKILAGGSPPSTLLNYLYAQCIGQSKTYLKNLMLLLI